jgi:hypothetical protein
MFPPEKGKSRSQWSHDLKNEMSSPAQTLGSWVRIPLEAWMSASLYLMFKLSCVGCGLVTNRSAVKGVLPTVCKIKISELIVDGHRPDVLLNGEAQIEEIAFSNMCSTQADNISWKLRLRCGCQFPWCSLALSVIHLVSVSFIVQ